MAIDPREQEKICILVVDDHGLTREMVRSILRAIGYTNVCVAENGNEAMHMMFENHPNLVICDWNMPHTSGIEFLRAVREEPKYSETPFIMLTAEAYRESVTEAIREGVSAYITKPFTAQVLQEKVEAALRVK